MKSGGEKRGARKVGREKWGAKVGVRKVGRCDDSGARKVGEWGAKSGGEKRQARKVGREKWG